MKPLTIFIISLLFLVGCNQSSVQHNTELEEYIYSIVKDKNNREVSIKSLANFNWDKAILFEPYTTQEGINEQLGVDFKDPSNIVIRDDIYLLVFLNDNKVVQYAEINRQKSDFSIEEKEYLTPSNDLINIERYYKQNFFIEGPLLKNWGVHDMESNERKKRLKLLQERRKVTPKPKYGVLFEECVEALGENVTVYSNAKGKELYDLFQQLIPFTQWSRIDWSKINKYKAIHDLKEVSDLFYQEDVEVYWGYGNFPVLKTKFDNIMEAFEDLVAVSPDTFLYVPQKYVIEVYHEGEITLGFL